MGTPSQGQSPLTTNGERHPINNQHRTFPELRGSKQGKETGRPDPGPPLLVVRQRYADDEAMVGGSINRGRWNDIMKSGSDRHTGILSVTKNSGTKQNPPNLCFNPKRRTNQITYYSLRVVKIPFAVK